MADILMITAIAGAENCAAVLSQQFQLHVDTASSRKEALLQLRRREYRLVVIDESMEADDFVRHCGMATPLEINFAISGYGRLERAVRAALSRREREKEVAAQAGASLMESELRETIAGLLLHAELALAEPTVPAAVAARLQVVAELAGILRKRLDAARSAASRQLSVRRSAVEATVQTAVPQKRTPLGGLAPVVASGRSGIAQKTMPPPIHAAMGSA